jgi:hypothetical protein
MRTKLTLGISLCLLSLTAAQPGLSGTATLKKAPQASALPGLSQSLTVMRSRPFSLPRGRAVGGGKQCNSGYDQCYNKLLNAGYCKPDYDKCMSLPASDGPIADYDSKPASKDALCAGLDPSACGTKLADLQNVYCQKKVMKCLEKSCGVPCP